MTRCGIGYDVHRFAANRDLVLGGVHIAHSLGLEGHSDADVLSHAIADAILGAIGERDIGHHFPNSDARWCGMNSLDILRHARDLVVSHGARLCNVDATLVAEEPKIGPYLSEMRVRIGDALAITPGRIGIKATTNEGLGCLGRGEGIAAFAVASVDAPDPPMESAGKILPA